MNYQIIKKNCENMRQQYCPLQKVRKKTFQRTLVVTQAELIMCKSQNGQRLV